MSEQEEQNLLRRIQEARIVPDVAGRDEVGRVVVFLANEHSAQPQHRERSPYFAI